MSSNGRGGAPNRLLASLPRRESARILAACEAVELELGTDLYEPDHPVAHVYFPTDSFISLMLPVDGVSSLEVGLVGNEGMLGTSLILGVSRSPLRARVQGAGPAWRMEARTFIRELGASAALRTTAQRFLQVHVEQLAQAAACTRFHVVEARLARRLLMTQDRAHNDNFHVTHEFLAYMLGVRRVGVTRAASALQSRKLIRYHRGEVTILSRRGMEGASCGCYRADKDRYATLLAGV
jgi:CRP-like cAMP-binding protein